MILGVATTKWWARLFTKLTGFQMWISWTGLIVLMFFSAALSVVSIPIAILMLFMRYRGKQAEQGAIS